MPFVYNGKKASCFYVTIQKRFLVVTAKHIFENPPANGTRIDYFSFQDKEWKIGSGDFYTDNDSLSDIAVICVYKNVNSGNPFDIGEKYIGLGQDIFFAGYPYGMIPDISVDNSYTKPLPFVKKASLSALEYKDSTLIIWGDGHNNPGFSGGPVFNMILKDGQLRTQLIGVISGYRIQQDVVHINEAKTQYYTKENSGILKATSISSLERIVDMIE
ncbi:serine protease [Maribellus sp. YY47]|uniref:S1 family peptidase n=1 Tax=Maribellus sp. YY47 TaxID=2929486 RepID=UPI002000E556|nr:serine protease [Maribellus sp. YY47]MCK3684796.1 serine protease [Maribellus sp. YY47]